MNAVLKTDPTLPVGYFEARARLAPALMKIGAVLTAESEHELVIKRPLPGGGMESGFELKLHETTPNAPLSPIYLNLRTPENPKPGPLTPDDVALGAVCMVYLRRARGLDYQGVVGVPLAGDPFADAFCNLTKAYRLQMDKYEQGGKRHIAGVKDLRNVSGAVHKVLVIDDLLTKAGSKIEAIMNLREAGFEVTDVLVLVDREQGGREELAKIGVTLHSVFTITELLESYVEAGTLTQRMRTKIAQYLLENS